MTDMIFYLAQSKVNQLDKCIQDKLDQALHLANKVSKNPDLAIRFQLEIEAGYRNQLTLSDLNRLFMLADMNEYRRATGLDDAQIKALHQAMAQYVNFSILKTHYEKIKKYAEEVRQDPTDQTKVYNLGYELFAENIVPTDDAAMQFFQKEEGLLIRPEQYDSIHMLLAKDEKTNNFNNVLIQARIGGGKSKDAFSSDAGSFYFPK